MILHDLSDMFSCNSSCRFIWKNFQQKNKLRLNSIPIDSIATYYLQSFSLFGKMRFMSVSRDIYSD